MAKTGRPTTYTPEIAEAICEEIATTDHALHRICEREDMPDHATVYRWLASNQDFCDKYARARERQADFMASQTVDIADDTSKDNSFAGSVAVARSRLRIDARKWLASKLAPKKYGDKIDATLQGPDGGPIQTEHIVVEYIRQNGKKDPV
jgi:hypothetical protein